MRIAIATVSLLLAVGCCKPKPNPQPLVGTVLPVEPVDRLLALPDNAPFPAVAQAAALDLADWRSYALSLRLLLVTAGATPTPATPKVPPSLPSSPVSPQ